MTHEKILYPHDVARRGSALRQVTLRDIAEAANVSTTAVSRVLHGGGTSVRVSEERAAHIRDIAEKLNYRANAVARNLRRSRTHTIGVLFENLNGLGDGPLYTTHLLDGVSSVLFKHGYRLSLLAEVDHDDIIGSLGDGQLDGVIWCKLARDPETVALIHQTPIPIVAINAAAPTEGKKAVYVTCNNQEGIELAVDHLWTLGHRNIAFLNEEQESTTPDSVDRREAYIKSISDRGSNVHTVQCGWHVEGAERELRARNCSAVICWSESLAGRLLSVLTKNGIQVPGEISIVGFDSTQYCETTNPRLTAIRQPIREMAAYAAQALLDLIAGQKSDQLSTIFPCALDVRGSTAIYLKAEEKNES